MKQTEQDKFVRRLFTLNGPSLADLEKVCLKLKVSRSLAVRMALKTLAQKVGEQHE